MNKFIIFIFFVFVTVNSFCSESLKVLILNFDNHSVDKKTNIYNKIIINTIKTDLSMTPVKIEAADFENNIYNKFKLLDDKQNILFFYEKDIQGKYYIRKVDETKPDDLDRINLLLNKIGYQKFNPYFYEDLFPGEKIPDLNDLSIKAFNKNIDLIITGYYIEQDNQIKITFKVTDVLTDRIKIIYSNSGKSDYNSFDVILDSTRDFIKKMYDNIKPYPDSMNISLKDKKSRLIAGDNKEIFLYLNSGILYSGFGFYNIINKNKDHFNLKNSKNIYYSSVNPFFNMEVYGNYKKNYYGFGFKFVIPFVYFIPNLHMRSDMSFAFLFAFKKEFFFNWNFNIFYIGLSKFKNNSEKILSLFYLGVGIGFNFRYMPEKYPFFIETGFTIVPPKISIQNQNKTGGGGPSFWNVSTDYVSDKNWILPVIINNGIGVFIKNNIGLYLKNSLYFMYISYEKYTSDNQGNYKHFYYGEDFGICFDIEFGMVFKGIFK